MFLFFRTSTAVHTKSITIPSSTTATARHQIQNKFCSSLSKYIPFESSSPSTSSFTLTSANSRHKYIKSKAVPTQNLTSKNSYTKFPVIMMSKHKLIRNITDDKKSFPKVDINTTQNTMNQYQNTSASTFKLKSLPPLHSTTTKTKQFPNNYISQQIPYPKTKLIKKFSVVNIKKDIQNNEKLKLVKEKIASSHPAHNPYTTAVLKTSKYSRLNKWQRPSYIPSKKIPILRKSRFMLIKKTAQPLIVRCFRTAISYN